MSIQPNMHSFLASSRLRILLHVDEFDLPPHDFSVTAEQRYQLFAGQRYAILNARGDGIVHAELCSWSMDSRLGPVATFLNTFGNNHFQVSNQQLAKLEDKGRFRRDGAVPDLGFAMTLKTKQMAAAERWLGYVDAIRDRAYAIDPKKVDKPGKKLIIEVAKAHAEATGDRKVPAYNTLKNKYRRAMSGTNDRAVAVAPMVGSGNTIKKITGPVATLLEEAAEEAWRMASGTWRDVKRTFLDRVKLPENEHLHSTLFDANGRLTIGDRAFQRAKAAVNHYIRDRLRYGPEYASRKHGIYLLQGKPDLPLEIVDCDFTELDIAVIDERTENVFGRPNIIVFRDRCTGSALGYSVFFDTASFRSFLSGLRHSMYPKDMSAFPGLSWKQYGPAAAYSFDNGLVSDDMDMAARRMGFMTVEHRPSHPWQKGMIERLFGILNMQLVHNLPGATMSNTLRRKMFDTAKNLGKPVLTLEELDKFLTVYFVEYNASPHNGLGPIAGTLSGVPDDLWDQGIAKATQRTPIDPFMFVHMANDHKYGAIQNIGVRWDNLVYASEELFLLRSNPKHVYERTGVDTTKYLMYRDPNDLSAIWVVDPYSTPERVIKVPICYEHAKYASGLTLFQHEQYLKDFHEKTKGRAPRDIDDLLEVQRTFAPRHLAVHEERQKQGTAKILARFFSNIGKKFRFSTIVNAPESAAASAERIDFENPFNAKPVDHGSSWNAEQQETNPQALYRVGTTALEPQDPVAADVEEWRATKPLPGEGPSRRNDDRADEMDDWINDYKPSKDR